jgi:hypothetical protein
MLNEVMTMPVAAQAGEGARQHQHMEVRRGGAGQVRQREQREHHQQQLLAVEAVDVHGGGQAGQAGAPGIGRHRARHGGRLDRERRHQLRRQRHHHHEIHDDGELGQRQQPEDETFAGRG